MDKEELEMLDNVFQLAIGECHTDDINKIAIVEKKIKAILQQNKKQKEIIDKAVEKLKQGITFCKNDSQGLYDKCNIAISREKEILKILEDKEV